MAGSKVGGIKAAETNTAKYGSDFYKRIGAMGGTKSRGGGWTGNPTAARIAGAKGGRKSKRGPIKKRGLVGRVDVVEVINTPTPWYKRLFRRSQNV